MQEVNWEEIARDLYEALNQTRHTRGVDVGDADIILPAMEKYEAASQCPVRTMMWRVNWHHSVNPYWIVTCRDCTGPEIRLPNVEMARKWCSNHRC